MTIMASNSTTPVPLPAELVKDLEVQARKAGMSLAAYVALLARVDLRHHDHEFTSVIRSAFAKYPHVLRKLAE